MKTVQNISNATKVIIIKRDSGQVITKTAEPNQFLHLTEEEYLLVYPLSGDTWAVVEGGVAPVPPPEPVAIMTTDEVAEGNINSYFTEDRARTASVEDRVTDGVSNKAPSENIVHDLLALKADLGLDGKVLPIQLPDTIMGTPGPQGEVGPAGPAGPQGLQGEVGSAGSQGLQGEVGPAGPQGLQGEVGPAGSQGLQGLQGEVGPAGPQGLQGAAGPQGLQGEVGPAVSWGFGATRPSTPTNGEMFFDSNVSVGKPIWWHTDKWVDAAGTEMT